MGFALASLDSVWQKESSQFGVLVLGEVPCAERAVSASTSVLGASVAFALAGMFGEVSEVEGWVVHSHIRLGVSVGFALASRNSVSQKESSQFCVVLLFGQAPDAERAGCPPHTSIWGCAWVLWLLVTFQCRRRSLRNSVSCCCSVKFHMQKRWAVHFHVRFGGVSVGFVLAVMLLLCEAPDVGRCCLGGVGGFRVC